MAVKQLALTDFRNILDAKIEQVVEENVTIQEEGPNYVLYARKPITLQGIHFSIHTPTEERLTIQFDGLTPERFKALGNRFEDWSRVVDNTYKVKTTRGRSWKGRGHRVVEPKDPDSFYSPGTDRGRVRLLRVSPFPSSYSNVLRGIRRDLYFTLRRHCLVLEGEKHGGYKQNIYILPYANAPSLMAEIQLQNNSIDELNGKIAAFRLGKEWQDFNAILTENNLDPRYLNAKSWHIGHLSFDATPLALEPSTVMDMVKTATGTIKSKLTEVEQKGMADLEAELERRRRVMVTQALDSLKKEVDANVAKIISGIKKDPVRAKRDLEHLRNKANSIGLEALATTVIDPLSALIDNPERVEELFGAVHVSELPGKIDGRIKSLIETI